jgi:hypothetical protein
MTTWTCRCGRANDLRTEECGNCGLAHCPDLPPSYIHIPGVEQSRYGWVPVVHRPGNPTYPIARFEDKTKTTREEAMKYATGIAYRRQRNARDFHNRHS